MKKLSKLVASAALCVSLFGGVAAAQAANTCTITNTGANSVNTCTFTATNVVTVTCTNTVTVTNVNLQNAVSGSANVSGNSVSGTATSGNASNINALANEIALLCAAAVPATTTPPAGGSGATATPTPAPVKALPKTGDSNVVAQAAIGAVSLLAVAFVAQAGIASYRRSIK